VDLTELFQVRRLRRTVCLGQTHSDRECFMDEDILRQTLASMPEPVNKSVLACFQKR